VGSWKTCAAALAVVGAIAVPGFELVAPAGAAAGGNSANAQACQQGGWKTLTRSDDTSFDNTGACVSYAAQGGTLTTSSLALCESYGGTFALGTGRTLWTCTGWSFTDMTNLSARHDNLAADCVSDGGSGLLLTSFTLDPNNADSACSLRRPLP
jgi:hypothetical protein